MGPEADHQKENCRGGVTFWDSRASRHARLTLPPAPSLCPEPKPYTAAEEARAARELVALPAGAMLAQMIADYGRERAELRACRR